MHTFYVKGMILNLPWWFGHDVQIGRVEAQSSGGQTVSDQVNPQKLDRDQSFGKAKSSGQEDGDDLTNVGGDQVTDELFHVVVDGTAFLNGGDNGGKVIISQDHFRGGFGNSGSGAHSNTDFGLLQSGSIIDTITSHGGNFLHGLQVLDDLGLVEGLDTSEHPGAAASSTLFRNGQVIKFTTREGLAFSAFVLAKDANTLANGLSGVLVVASDHDDTNAGLTAPSNGGLNLEPGGIQHTDDTDESQVDLVFGEFGGIFQVHFLGVHGGVASGQSQAPKGVTAGTILNSLVHNLVADSGGHGLFVTTNSVMSTPVQDTFGSTLDEHLGSGANAGWFAGSAERGHGFTVPENEKKKKK